MLGCLTWCAGGGSASPGFLENFATSTNYSSPLAKAVDLVLQRIDFPDRSLPGPPRCRYRGASEGAPSPPRVLRGCYSDIEGAEWQFLPPCDFSAGVAPSQSLGKEGCPDGPSGSVPCVPPCHLKLLTWELSGQVPAYLD